MKPIGRKRWAIPEGFVPGTSSGDLRSHETACILNTGGRDAHVKITLFFADEEPKGPYEVVVKAERTRHLRFDEDLPLNIVPEKDYASVLESDVPIVVQHTRLDSRQDANALFSTAAYGE